jgi:quercetin dioxygenase-like cupin family protein
MTRDEFLLLAAQDAAAELVLVTRPANAALDQHAHPFDAKALVVRGELTIAVDGVERLYQAGAVFHLPAGCVHSERYGAAGVIYLVARS